MNRLWLILLALLPLALPAQRESNTMWRSLLMENIRTAGSISNVSVVGDQLYFCNAGVLFSAPLTANAISDVDTLFTAIDKEMNYVVEQPATKHIYYTKRVGRRTQLYRVETDGKGHRVGAQVRLGKFKGSVVHPTFSKDGSLMVFSSNDEGGHGGFDLWYTKAEGEDWGDPVNLGSRINSDGHEFSPTMWGDWLFFSSDQGDSTDYDIFVTRLVSIHHMHGDTAYTFPIGLAPVQRMPYPLNDEHNNFGIAFTPQCAFFVSKAEGHDRLFRLEGELRCTSYWVYVEDERHEPIPHAALRILTPDGKQQLSSATGDESGRCVLYLPSGESFLVEVSAPNYLSKSMLFRPSRDNDDEFSPLWAQHIELESFSLHVPHPYQAQRLFGAESGSELIASGIDQMANLVRFLRENPHLHLTVTVLYAHHSSPSYCELLNQSRLQALRQYFALQGIPSESLTVESATTPLRQPNGGVMDNVVLFRFD